MESTTEYILLGKWWSFRMSRATPSSSKVLRLCLAVVVVVVDVDGVVGGEVLLGHPDLPTSPSLCY